MPALAIILARLDTDSHTYLDTEVNINISLQSKDSDDGSPEGGAVVIRDLLRVDAELLERLPGPGVVPYRIRLNLGGVSGEEAASLQQALPVHSYEDEVILHQVHEHLPDQLSHVHS